jgi:hypothetical protein
MWCSLSCFILRILHHNNAITRTEWSWKVYFLHCSSYFFEFTTLSSDCQGISILFLEIWLVAFNFIWTAINFWILSTFLHPFSIFSMFGKTFHFCFPYYFCLENHFTYYLIPHSILLFKLQSQQSKFYRDQSCYTYSLHVYILNWSQIS